MANKISLYGGIGGVFSLWPALNYSVLIKAMNGGLAIIYSVRIIENACFVIISSMHKKQNLPNPVFYNSLIYAQSLKIFLFSLMVLEFV